MGDLARVPQDSGHLVGRSRGERPEIADQLGHSPVSVTQDFYIGRKIASQDAVRVLEVIGVPDAAALTVSADRGRGE